MIEYTKISVPFERDTQGIKEVKQVLKCETNTTQYEKHGWGI